jgi:hypothetical protein
VEARVKGRPLSPYPPASVARVLAPHQQKIGATLIARTLGFLAVKVTFHKVACPDLEVKFYEAEADGKKGAQVGAAKKTNRAGLASADKLVPAGLYVCEIENQAAAIVVPTVADPDRPHPIPTPIDRPYFDFDEAAEFDDQIEERALYESLGDGEAALEDASRPGVMTISFAAKSEDAFDGSFPRFSLESSDGAYARTVTAKQALVDKDGWKQIVFRNLIEGSTYRLTKHHDAEFSEVVFDGAPYEAVVRRKHDLNQALAEHRYGGFACGAPSPVTWG